MSFFFKPLSLPGLQDTIAFGFPLADLLQSRIVTPTVTATTLDTETMPVHSWKGFNVTSARNVFALAAGAVRAVAKFVVGDRIMYSTHPATADISNGPDMGKSSALVLYSAFWGAHHIVSSNIVKYEQPEHTYSHTCHCLSRLHCMFVHSRHMLFGMPTPYLYTRHRLLSWHTRSRISSAASTFTLCSLNQIDGDLSFLSCWNISDLDNKPSTLLHIIGDSYKYALGSSNGDLNDEDVIVYRPRSNPWLTHDYYQLTDPTETDASERSHINNAVSDFDQPHLDPTKSTPSDDALHMKSSSMLKRRQKYVPQTDADAECRSSIGIPSRRVPLVAMDPTQIQASPPPTSIAQLSEYMQQVELTDSLLATDPVTPGSDTELDSIFDSDETYTDSSTPESPSCEPWISDFLDSENESGQPHRRVFLANSQTSGR
ncbi:hypothetical protein V1505DRAFT_352184 [Lipomyces doorenjongii]